MHKVDDDRIISTVKKNNLKKSNQAGNTLKILVISLLTSTNMKRRGFTTRFKPPVTLKNMKVR